MKCFPKSLFSSYLQVLLGAGPGGYNSIKIVDVANASNMTSEPFCPTPTERKRLYGTLKNCLSFIMFVGNGKFAHAAFPGKLSPFRLKVLTSDIIIHRKSATQKACHAATYWKPNEMRWSFIQTHDFLETAHNSVQAFLLLTENNYAV